MAMTQTAAGARYLPFVFTGRGADYFGIWIVNLLLSIITIGIYSAWAKVRRLRYLYGNTFLDDHAFDYHARPIAILRGRIVVVAVIVAINLLGQLRPELGGLASLILLVLIPFGIMLSLRFNARVTSWRNVRFDFDLRPKRDFLRGFAIFALMPLASVVSLGLLLPVATRLAWNFILRRLRYGQTPLLSDIPLGRLYGALFAAALFLIGATILLVLAGAGIAVGSGGFAEVDFDALDDGGADDPEAFLVLLPLMAASFVGMFVMIVTGVFYGALARNAVLSSTVLDRVGRLESTMSPWRKAWIVVSNTLLVLFTVGLATPWATVRSWRYGSETIAAHLDGDLDAVVGAAQAAGTAVGSEWADMEGFDVGF